MDPSTASYYRAILFVDSTDTRPLPATLVQLHSWTVKRNLALGLGGVISKAVALSVALTWLSSTDEGREFAARNTNLGELFGEVAPELEDDQPVVGEELWDTLPAESDVTVTLKNKTTKPAKFLKRQGNWVHVRVNGENQAFRISKVKIG